MNREEIDDMVCKIMVRFGPDGQVDGHDVITVYIVSLLDGKPFDIDKVEHSFF